MARVPEAQKPIYVNGGCTDYSYSCGHWGFYRCGGNGLCGDRSSTCSDSITPRGAGCYGYTGAWYTCPGHREADDTRSDIEDRIEHPTLSHTIYAKYLNDLYDVLNKEISSSNSTVKSRTGHKMYSSFKRDDAKTRKEYTIEATSSKLLKGAPNSLEKSIEKLRKKIEDYEDYKYPNTISNYYNNINVETVAKHDQLSSMYSEINYKWKDCICHGDCTAFGSIWHSSCGCNPNCNCDYAFM